MAEAEPFGGAGFGAWDARNDGASGVTFAAVGPPADCFLLRTLSDILSVTSLTIPDGEPAAASSPAAKLGPAGGAATEPWPRIGAAAAVVDEAGPVEGAVAGAEFQLGYERPYESKCLWGSAEHQSRQVKLGYIRLFGTLTGTPIAPSFFSSLFVHLLLLLEIEISTLSQSLLLLFLPLFDFQFVILIFSAQLSPFVNLLRCGKSWWSVFPYPFLSVDLRRSFSFSYLA